MMNTVAVVAALASLAAADLKVASNGGALVINYCNEPMPLQNIPATRDGVENAQATSKTLAAYGQGDNQYYQPWTALNCDGGWSMKIAPNGDWSNIYQFEYTWQSDNQIWYDMSFVNGVESSLPKWAFTCPQSPTPPHNNAYQYPTDDANGMQVPVQSSATVTLSLCPENKGNSGSGSGSSGSSASPASSSPATSAAPTTTSSTAAKSTTPSTTLKTTTSADYKLKQAQVSTPTPPSNGNDDSDVKVVYEYLTVTAVVTETASVSPTPTPYAHRRRHEHRHPHGLVL